MSNPNQTRDEYEESVRRQLEPLKDMDAVELKKLYDDDFDPAEFDEEADEFDEDEFEDDEDE